MLRNKFTAVKTARRRSKSSATWLRRQLNDPYVKMAQAEGYRSRAAFKIVEIDEKFKLFKAGKIVVDLGAAPGGWSQVAVGKVGAGNVIAIDLLDMDEIDGVKFMKLDFLAENAQEVISREIRREKCDVILSDMAANTCGDAQTDHLRIIGMLEETLEFATKVLANNGSFVGKVFQGGASGDLLNQFKKKFKVVKHFKPDSSRKESAENYIVATGFIGLVDKIE